MLREHPMVVSSQYSSSPRPSSRADELIAALDLHRVGDGAGSNVVYVFGVHTDGGGDLWIQVGHSEDGCENVVLRLSSEATVEDAIATLKTMLPRRRQYPRIVAVTHQTSTALTSRL